MTSSCRSGVVIKWFLVATLLDHRFSRPLGPPPSETEPISHQSSVDSANSHMLVSKMREIGVQCHRIKIVISPTFLSGAVLCCAVLCC